MASRPRNVDLGPMYLQVGVEAPAQGPTPPSQDSDAADVSRFESLMRKGREQQQRRESDSPADELLDPLRGPKPQGLAEPGDIGDEIAHLWVGTGQRGAREVRVGLRDALLPDTSVRLHESGGVLRIEFTCGSAHVANWLDRKSAVLARELGERLRRDVEIVSFMSDGSLVGSAQWSENLR
jgi:hypothetical protein